MTELPAVPAAAIEPEPLRQARKAVKRLRDFYVLCMVAALVIALTGVINLVTSPGRLWFLWVVFGFCIAIGFSALDVFARNRFFGTAWQERKLREILARQRG